MDEFKEILEYAQGIQRRYYQYGNVCLNVKYDSYYEDYLEMEFRNDKTKVFVSTLTSLTVDESRRRLSDFSAEVRNLIGDDNG